VGDFLDGRCKHGGARIVRGHQFRRHRQESYLPARASRAGPDLPPTATMRSPSVRTSPVKPGAPTPPRVVPPDMTMSCINVPPWFRYTSGAASGATSHLNVICGSPAG
jgi:hypothetical protein